MIGAPGKTTGNIVIQEISHENNQLRM